MWGLSFGGGLCVCVCKARINMQVLFSIIISILWGLTVCVCVGRPECEGSLYVWRIDYLLILFILVLWDVSLRVGEGGGSVWRLSVCVKNKSPHLFFILIIVDSSMCVCVCLCWVGMDGVWMLLFSLCVCLYVLTHHCLYWVPEESTWARLCHTGPPPPPLPPCCC